MPKEVTSDFSTFQCGARVESGSGPGSYSVGAAGGPGGTDSTCADSQVPSLAPLSLLSAAGCGPHKINKSERMDMLDRGQRSCLGL